MRKALVFVVTLLTIGFAHAQEVDHTQYFLNLPGINPAFTGIEDFLDARASFRQGWNNFNVKNNYSFASAYGALNNTSRTALTNNTLRFDDESGRFEGRTYRRSTRKHGIGGMLTSRNLGQYTASSASINYAYHLPISNRVKMSFGTQVSYFANRISPEGFTVRDDVHDSFYQQLMASNTGNFSYFAVDFGYTIYSSNFYLGVSSTNLVASRLSGETFAGLGQPLKLNVQAALTRIPIGSNFTLSPGVRVTYVDGSDMIYNVNMRLRYKEALYIGSGYSFPNSRMSLMAGININRQLRVSYAFDKYLSDLNNFNVTVHEIVIGLSLFNRYNSPSLLW
ncbi:MAG: PorP/SprF family type IX secretion system membrane protein [Bacteroidota bacterium]